MAEPPYRVQAFNSATHSENRMHDDAVAQKYGFSGGLVPGVDVFAYMVHVPVAKWGRAFLERGLMEVRFAKPVYDGETVVVTSEPSDEGLAIALNGSDVRAAGSASLPDAPPRSPLAIIPRLRRLRCGAGRSQVLPGRQMARNGAALLAGPIWSGLSGGSTRNRSNLCSRRVGASRYGAAGYEPGLDGERFTGAVDSSRQPHADAVHSCLR